MGQKGEPLRHSKLLAVGSCVVFSVTPLATLYYPQHNGTQVIVPSELHAIPLKETSGPGTTRPGTPVKPGKILVRVAATRMTWFALADLNGSVYPAISTDGDNKWRVDGPCFFTSGAGGAAVTSTIGAGGAEFAFAWGQFGNYVKTTSDAGERWWETDFSYGVDKIMVVKNTLTVRAFGPHERSHCTFVDYVSSDQGYTWEQRGPVTTGPCITLKLK